MNKKYVCCICGKEFVRFGNNPWPVNNDPEERCCDECNMTVVIPQRIKNLKYNNHKDMND